MKIIYRGNSYQVPAPIQVNCDSAPQPQYKLIYRGNTINYTPCPLVVAQEDKTDGLTVNLIYRGNTYQRQMPALQSYQKPRAINWRWQLT